MIQIDVKSQVSLVYQDSVTTHPLALLETEKVGFEDKLNKMREEMDEALARSVREHEEKMKRFEEESQEKIDREREALEVERSRIRTKREEIDNEIKAFIESNGFEKSQFLSTSTESLTKRRYSSKWMKF